MAEEEVHGCVQLGVHPNQGYHSEICQKSDEINKEKHGKQNHFVLSVISNSQENEFSQGGAIPCVHSSLFLCKLLEKMIKKMILVCVTLFGIYKMSKDGMSSL